MALIGLEVCLIVRIQVTAQSIPDIGLLKSSRRMSFPILRVALCGVKSCQSGQSNL